MTELSTVEQCQAALDEGAKPGEVYRQFSKDLRADPSPFAQAMLAHLMMATTIPWNELETPGWIDGYTGEVEPEEAELHIQNKGVLGLVEAVDAQEDLDLEKASAEFGKLEGFRRETAMREPYPTPEANRRFIAATSFVGADEEPEWFEDDTRGVESLFEEPARRSPELALLERCLAVPAQRLQGFIRRQIAAVGGDPREAPYVRRRVRQSGEAQTFLRLLTDAADRGFEHADIASMYLRFDHGFAFAWDEREKRRPDDKDPARQVMLTTMSLRSWLDDHEDELLEGQGFGLPVERGEPTESEIDSVVANFLRQLEDETDDSLSPVRSRAFVVGWVTAAAEGVANPLDRAWCHWMKNVSPQGYDNYVRLLQQTGDRKRARSAFYLTAERTGELKSKPKSIMAFNQQGLVLTNKRRVNWQVATLILNKEGYDHDKDELRRLHATLSERGWGPAFVRALATHLHQG